MEEIACILCLDSVSEVVIRENGFDGRQCSRCGLIFVSPRPSAEETADLYLSDSAFLPAKSHLARSDNFAARAATKSRLSILRKYAAPGSTILEIGAGSGSFLAEAKDQGFDVAAIELNPLQADFIRRGLGIPCAPSLSELRQLTGRLTHDVVYFRNVISHFFDPIAELAEIHAALSAEGILVFETGNLADVNHRYFRYFLVFQLPDHLFFYGERSLKALLDVTGFELVTTRRWSILPQLRLLRAIRRLRGRSGDVAEVGGGAEAGRSPLREAVVYIVEQLVPYRLGALAPKRGRPQTVLVIARKAGATPQIRRPSPLARPASSANGK